MICAGIVRVGNNPCNPKGNEGQDQPKDTNNQMGTLHGNIIPLGPQQAQEVTSCPSNRFNFRNPRLRDFARSNSPVNSNHQAAIHL